MDSPGARLKAYIRARWDRKAGGDVALARVAGIRRQTLQDWYAGKDTPSLGHLEAVAETLGVRRVDLVAAYDGVTAPEHEEAAPPDWAERLERRLDVLVSRAGVNPAALNEDETSRLVREALARASSPQRSGGGV